jgi:hypothetical protein
MPEIVATNRSTPSVSVKNTEGVEISEVARRILLPFVA